MLPHCSQAGPRSPPASLGGGRGGGGGGAPARGGGGDDGRGVGCGLGCGERSGRRGGRFAAVRSPGGIAAPVPLAVPVAAIGAVLGEQCLLRLTAGGGPRGGEGGA